MTALGSAKLCFRGAMTIQTADASRGEVLKALGSAGVREIVIDCSAVDEVDVTFIQMLLTARVGAMAMGKRLALESPAVGALRAALLRGGFLDAGTASEDHQFWTSGRD